MGKKSLDQYYPGLHDACRRAYNKTIDAIRDAGHRHGYAIAVHGSLARDIDLVAIPWTEDATDALSLVGAVIRAAAAHGPHATAFLSRNETNPTPKPHGRLCWAIHLADGVYIDLAVMPRSFNEEKRHG